MLIHPCRFPPCRASDFPLPSEVECSIAFQFMSLPWSLQVFDFSYIMFFFFIPIMFSFINTFAHLYSGFFIFHYLESSHLFFIGSRFMNRGWRAKLYVSVCSPLGFPGFLQVSKKHPHGSMTLKCIRWTGVTYRVYSCLMPSISLG